MNTHYPQPLQNLSLALSALPGIGPRTAERLALALLDWDKRQLQNLGELIETLKDQIHFCQFCGNLTDTNTCQICLDPSRNHQLICVVENVKQIQVVEKSDRYNGLFHVLGGRLSPLDDVDINDLNVDSLFRRIKSEHVEEVIISTSPDVEGEATAIYLAEELDKLSDLVVSRIAFGVPVGSDLTFADSATMGMAIDSRRPFK